MTHFSQISTTPIIRFHHQLDNMRSHFRTTEMRLITQLICGVLRTRALLRLKSRTTNLTTGTALLTPERKISILLRADFYQPKTMKNMTKRKIWSRISKTAQTSWTKICPCLLQALPRFRHLLLLHLCQPQASPPEGQTTTYFRQDATGLMLTERTSNTSGNRRASTMQATSSLGRIPKGRTIQLSGSTLLLQTT